MAGVGTNLTNTTSLATFIPTILETKVMAAVDRTAIWEKLIGEENTFNFTGPGKSHDLNQLPTATMAATTEATEQDDTTITPTKRTITLATYGVTFTPSWEGVNFSAIQLEAQITRIVEAAYTTLIETSSTSALSFAGMYAEASASNPDHLGIGTDGTQLTEDNILQGDQLLGTALAPNERYYVIDPIQRRELMNDSGAKQWMQNRTADIPSVAALGIMPNRYLGTIHGVPVFVANAMIESSGLHSIMFAKGAFGVGYKMISTPLSPTPSRINIDIEYKGSRFGWVFTVRTIFDVTGLVFTNTTNKWLVDIIS